MRAELRCADRVEPPRIYCDVVEVMAMKNCLQGGHIAPRSSGAIEKEYLRLIVRPAGSNAGYGNKDKNSACK
jgi:hypothetical protein